MTASHPTLHAWFGEVAAEHASAHAIEAVVDGEPCVLTYAQLDELSNRIAEQVDRSCPGPLVGLVGHAHPATHASYLAIIKSGRTVVPLHPDEPARRVAEQLTLLGVRDVLSASPSRQAPTWVAAGIGLREVTLQGVQGPAPRAGATGDSADERHTTGAAYVLRTSGSTGQPKLVPVTHAAAVGALSYMIRRYAIGPGSRLSATFRLSFDVSVYDTFGALLSGATLVLPLNREPLLPASYVRRGGLTHWCSVPSVAVLAHSMGALRPDSMPDLRHTIFCGEPLRLSVAEAWRHAAPGSVIDNSYGPTELTVFCADYRLPADRAEWPTTVNGTVPIGAVYPHLERRIDGTGELMIRGSQRFDGYVDPADNAGRFWPDPSPITPVAADVWYRTGDRVEVDPAAGLVLLGRLDRQVKLNGYRVELSEVEWHLERQYAAQAAAVLIEQDLVQHLAAVVARRDLATHARSTRPAPVETLPPHLRPTRIRFVASLPLNANGKIDYAQVAQLLKEG